MRDRLVSLINKDENCPSHYMCSDKCKYSHLEHCIGDRLADSILADGWIRLPCKVGDTVYVISRYYTGTWQIYSCTVEYITHYKSNGFINAIFSKDINFGVNITEFGKTVFLTKEQAEQKLKEMRVENDHK